MTSHLLYSDTVKLIFNPKAHRYTISSLVAKGKWSQARPVRGVTSYLNVLSKPHLINWAAGCAADLFYKEVTNGSTALDARELAKKAHLQRSQVGKDFGTTIHDAIEKYLSGEDPGLLQEDHLKVFNVFIEWLGSKKILYSERILYSKELNYAGKCDLIFEDKGKIVLADIKTTNRSYFNPDGIYIDYFAQLGGYAKPALEEGLVPQIDDLAIINPGKDGDLVVKYASDFGMSVEDALTYWFNIYTISENHRFWDYQMKGGHK